MSKFILASLVILLSMVSSHDTSVVLYEDFIPDQQYEQTKKRTETDGLFEMSME